ncbi:MAG: hypothetical protein ACFE7R_05660 [Candidatus Hodarchaeota archaeon]
MGQVVGTILGMVTAFIVAFVILTLGNIMPEDLISSVIVSEFFVYTELEMRLAVVGTILYPSALGSVSLGALLDFGAQGATVLMALAWGTGGLIAGLFARDFINGIIAAIFAVVFGAFLTWLLVFFIQVTDIALLFGTGSLLLLQAVLEGSVYPAIAAVIGGLLGGGVSRER